MMMGLKGVRVRILCRVGSGGVEVMVWVAGISKLRCYAVAVYDVHRQEYSDWLVGSYGSSL